MASVRHARELLARVQTLEVAQTKSVSVREVLAAYQHGAQAAPQCVDCLRRQLRQWCSQASQTETEAGPEFRAVAAARVVGSATERAVVLALQRSHRVDRAVWEAERSALTAQLEQAQALAAQLEVEKDEMLRTAKATEAEMNGAIAALQDKLEASASEIVTRASQFMLARTKSHQRQILVDSESEESMPEAEEEEEAQGGGQLVASASEPLFDEIGTLLDSMKSATCEILESEGRTVALKRRMRRATLPDPGVLRRSQTDSPNTPTIKRTTLLG